jgi:hypothetical protein
MTAAAIDAEGHSLGIEKNGHFFAVRKRCRGHQALAPRDTALLTFAESSSTAMKS